MREYVEKNKKAISEYKHNWCLENRGDRRDRPKKIEVLCGYCRKTLLVQPNIDKKNQTHYCNLKCRNLGYSENKKGSSSHFWKGGKTKESKLLRVSAKYKQWRVKVFQRDKYTCQHCWGENCYLHAHHIKAFSDFPKLRYIVDNGLTLCVDCHRETGTWGNK